MFSAPSICRRCLSKGFRPLTRPSVRWQSNAPATAEASLSPALLSRAQAVANEYSALQERIAENFDQKTAKRIGELTPVATALQDYKKANESLKELRSILSDSSTDPELASLADEDVPTTLAALAKATNCLTSALIPKHPFAHLPCLLEIRPGVGGSEAALFAADLLRMYTTFSSRNGFRANMMKYEDAAGMSDPNGSDSPLQEAIIEIESEGAYGRFRTETGVHRVQRIPATESKGRVHTSVASVLVMPSMSGQNGELDEEDFNNPESDYYIDPTEVRTDIMRARGAGGQHVNTTESAVRLTHIPTNTVVSIQDSRSQPKNKEKAWALLRSRLAQSRREAREVEMAKMRRNAGAAKSGRADKVRTYNFNQQRVTDHRCGLSVHDLDDVMEGGENLSKLMESVSTWMDEQDVAALVAEGDEAQSSAKKS